MTMNESMQTLNTATAISKAFPVRKLEEVSKIELEEGQYLVRKIEKGTGKESKGVIIPAMGQESFLIALENDAVLQAACNWYQEQIGEVCKKLIAEGASTIVASDYAIETVVAYLQEQEVKEGRVSKEKIGVWFENSLTAKLCSALKAKYGESLSNEKVLEMKELYKAGFQTLAKRDLDMAQEKKANLLKLLEQAPDCGMKSYCEGKLKQAQEKTIEMLGL